MSAETESLRDLYLDVAGEAMITETQEEGHSHAPLDDESEVGAEVSAVIREDGLKDAVDGFDTDSGQ